jgi:glutamine amidotransferase
MARLRQKKLADLIPSLTQPVLGICLGMQLLAQHSEEQDTACLGILPATATRLPATADLPAPNMGWCRIEKLAEHPLLVDIADGSFFYFVHSYALAPGEISLANATHARKFCAIAAHRNFYAAQFHPERSQAAGAQLLRNFVNLPA